MKLSEAIKIFENIESEEYNPGEKGMAILQVCEMPSHNSITKSMMLRVLRWLLELAFELPSAGVLEEEKENALQ